MWTKAKTTVASSRSPSQIDYALPETFIKHENKTDRASNSTMPANTTHPDVNIKRSSVFFFNLDSFNIYFITILTVVLCLFMSVLILLVVLCIGKRIEKAKLKKSYTTKIATRTSELRMPSTYYVKTFTVNGQDDDDEDEVGDDDEDEDDDQDSFQQTNSSGGGLIACCQVRALNKRLCVRERSSSFDSYNSASNANHDSGSVPVSRSIEHLYLYINVYFNVNDQDYVYNYLLPVLRKCLTIVPDTKFLMRPQNGKYVTSCGASDSTSISNQEYLNNSSSLATTTTTIKSSCGNYLIANIVVVSDNFHGSKSPTHVDSLTPVKYKTGHFNHADNTSNSSSSSGTGSSCTTQATSGGGCYNTNSFLTSSKVKKSRQTSAGNFENNLKNSFKVHLTALTTTSGEYRYPNEIIATTTSKTSSFNKCFLRKLYDTSGRQKANSTLVSHNRNISTAVMNTNMRNQSRRFNAINNNNINNNQLTIIDDLFNTYAYSERLQCKLEKYFEHICLKSNQFFSKTNFSYVDYTKR